MSQLLPMNGQRKVSGREIRRRLNSSESFITGEVAPAVRQLLHNQAVAKQKIDALETAQAAWLALTCWQRLRWIVTGSAMPARPTLTIVKGDAA